MGDLVIGCTHSVTTDLLASFRALPRPISHWLERRNHSVSLRLWIWCSQKVPHLQFAEQQVSPR